MPNYYVNNFFSSHFSFDNNPKMECIGILVKNTENWQANLHSHDNIEILLVTQGNGWIELNKIIYSLKKGFLVIIPPGIEHREGVTYESDFVFYYIRIKNVNIDLLSHIGIQTEAIIPLTQTGDFYFRLLSIFKDIMKECSIQNLWYEKVCSNLVIEITVLISRILNKYYDNSVNSDSLSLAEKVKHYIDANFRQHLTVTRIAEIFHVSPDHISRIFKNDIKTSIISYIHANRMKEAKKILSETELPIETIAVNIGYNTVSYFYKVFKQIHNITPGEFRKMQKENYGIV